MKILYVLTSSESDFYCEQAIISMMSAKYQMPNSFISLLIDSETESNLKGTRKLINEYISEKNVINLDSSLSSTQKSRWLKTSMRELVKGDFLYVDVDTVFAAPINDSFFTHDVMGVPDGNCLLKDHPLRWQIEDNLKKLQFSNTLDYHINGGVLFLRDTPIAHSFASRWHKRWQECRSKGISIDQLALHQAFVDSKLEQHLLPGFMNAQFGRNINTLANGIILHYYSSWTNDSTYIPAYKFLQKEWLLKFRNNPKSGIFQKDIHNPKEAFDPNTFILGRHFNSFWNTQLIQHLMNLWISTDRADKRLFKISEKIILTIKIIYYRGIKILHPLRQIASRIIR